MWWQHSAHNSELPVLPTTLCENSTQSGYTDWRLPNIRELESLTDDLRQNPNINTSIFTPSLNHDYAWLLSSTSNTMFPGEKWYIELMSGRSDSYISLNTILGCDMGLYFCEYFVKCVRGLDSSLPVTLTGIVTDASTMQSLEDVSITVTDLQNIHSTLTDSNGQYIIENLVPGNFIGVFEKSGYITHTENGVLINGQTLVLDIQLALIPSPLTVIITSPENGAILNSSPVEVTGTVSNNAEVTVNGIDATVNNDIFSATIPLNEGQNTITAIAHDEFGQTETQNVTVTLLTKGSITGKVTDVMTGLPVPDSQVSITDSLNNILSAITDSSGQYTVNAVSQGNFTGMISKDCYMPHHFSGTVMPGQVHMYDANLHPAPPTISDIALSTVSYDSATITWTTDHLSDSTVEYGIDASYGNSVTDATLTTAHSITLTNLLSETTYHFMVTSTNSNNLSASSEDDTFITLNPITVTITSPLDGATLSHADITVSGTITNAQGNETGVVVNGTIATLNGNNFVANNIPLIEGSNTIAATATDTTGNTSSTSLGINLQTPVHYIRLTSNIESGISPLETTFRIEGSFSFDESSIFVTGPTQPEFIESDVDEYTFRLTMEGIYYFTANVTGPDGLAYEDTIAINVIDQPEIDTLLQNKWTSLTNNLRDSKIQHALLWITSESQKVYEEIFNALIDQLPFIMSTEIEFNLISIHNGIATYDLVTKEDGRNLSYEVIFITDSNGIWKIHEF
jgi:hypothetical protein